MVQMTEQMAKPYSNHFQFWTIYSNYTILKICYIRLSELSDCQYMKLVFLLLIVLAAAQICPYCAPGACTTTTHGLSNCSKCWTGALVKVQTVVLPPLSPFASDTIGICQLCPKGCITCNYAVIAPAMSIAFQGINCTSCERAHTYNYATGFCSKCSANCIRCQCIMAGCSIINCLACRSGYSLGKSVDNGHACVKNTNGQGNGDGRRLSNYEESQSDAIYSKNCE